MKAKNITLDIDFIGGQTELTNQEIKTLSEYFKKKRKVATKRPTPRKKKKLKTIA